MLLSNFHAHTTYCDGKNTVEEMVRGAIDKGLVAFGLSGHSFTPSGFEEMTPENVPKYRAEMQAAKEKYAGQIELFCGVEQDFMSEMPTNGYDYVIGSTHSVTLENHECVVDWTAEKQIGYVGKYCDGDFYAFVEAYFAREAQIAVQTKCDVVGHFDIIAKFNEGGRYFDEAHPRYRDASIAAMEEILKSCRLFEVNTNGMYKLGRTNPYPAPWLLKELHQRGGEVIISSDSHDVPSICYKFEEMAELLRTIGFKYRKTLTRSGFVDIAL